MRLDAGKPTPPEDSPKQYNAFRIQAGKPLAGKSPDAPPPAYDELSFLASPGGDTPATCRWPDTAFPLQIWFDDNPELPEFENELFGMLAQWEYASGNKIGFVKTNAEENANVTIHWFDEPVPGRDFELGHTDRTVIPNPEKSSSKNGGQPDGLITFVKVNLHAKPLENAQFCTKNASKTRLFATILHEFGHVLGLEHSTNPSDTMFHRGFQNARLSDNDVRRLKLLYRL